MDFSTANLPPIPPSPPRSFASTTVLPTSPIRTPPPPPLPKHFLNRSDVAGSIKAYEGLAEAAKMYRKALSAASVAASAFGAAFEQCARCKSAGDTASGLMNAGGLQYLIASNLNLLSQTLHRGFEAALLHEVDRYKEKNLENEKRYMEEAEEQSRELRKLEQQHLRIARQKSRNLSAFRNALVCLTEQIDSLESLKYAHCRAAYDLSQDTASHVLESSALVVRAEVEVFERIAQKGWDSSGGLDDLIAISPDPFTMNHGPSESGDGPLFSILPTESILPNPRGSLSRAADVHGAASERKPQSIAEGLMSDGHMGYQDDEDSQSILSDGFRHPCITQNQGVLAPESASSAGWGLDDMSGSDTEQCSESATRSMNRLVAPGSTSLWDPGVELEGPMSAR